ncbi:MAG: hypothetical protein GY856_06615, partial [bacterium]|nr:hypothetical protein [bacterium]
WAVIGALLAFFGFTHAGEMTPAGGVYDIGWATGWEWCAGYLLCGAFFVLMHLWASRGGSGKKEPMLTREGGVLVYDGQADGELEAP